MYKCLQSGGSQGRADNKHFSLLEKTFQTSYIFRPQHIHTTHPHLHNEAVQGGPKDPIVIIAVDERRIGHGLLGPDAVHDTLKHSMKASSYLLLMLHYNP